MKHSLTTKQILSIFIILVIAVSVFYAMLLLNIKEKNNNVSFLINEVDIILQKEIKLRSTRSLIREIETERKELDSRFIADDKIINFIEMIENIGADSGAEIEVVSVSINSLKEETVGQVGISELLNLDLKTEGSFVQLFHFLSMVEKLPFKIDISRINLEKAPNKIEKSFNLWNGFFSITALKLK